MSGAPWRNGARWTLEPWNDHDVMRVVLPLDETSVQAAAERARRDRAEQRLRPVMWLLMPVLGLAAASWQRRWRDEWGFPAALRDAVTDNGRPEDGTATHPVVRVVSSLAESEYASAAAETTAGRMTAVFGLSRDDATALLQEARSDATTLADSLR